MSCNGVGALKCQCLCQLPKHAASLQSKITGTGDSARLKCKRILFLLSVYLALCDIEGIFKLSNTFIFSSYSCTIDSILKKNC